MITPGIPIEITIEELLEKVSDEQIAFKYVSNLKHVGEAFKSELRTDRRGTSCFVFKDKISGRLMYKDWADPKLPTKINLFEYVALKFNIQFQEAVNMIARDFNIVSSKGPLYERSKHQIYQSSDKEENISPESELIIKIKKRDWTLTDIEYWKQYYIPVELLERNNIKSISHIWLFRDNKQIFHTKFSDKHPVFSYDYYFSNNIFRRKIYRPLLDNYKWTTNTDYTVVQNYPNIPKEGDLLFIQSSYKDAMVMELMGYNAIAPNAESCWLPLKYWEKIKKRWKKIVIFGNNDWEKKDNPGLSYSINHSKRYGIPYIVIPDGETSDISDYVKKYDLEKGKYLTERLLNGIY